MFRALTVIAVIAAVVVVAVLRGRYVRSSSGGDEGVGAVSRFPRLEGLSARLCALTFVGLTLTGFYDLIVYNRLMHSYVLLVHVGLGGAFAAALAGLSFLRAEANSPGVGPAVPGSTLRKTCFWIFVATGLALILTAALAMVPWLGTQGQLRIIDFHRWAALLSLVAGIGYAGLRVKRRAQIRRETVRETPVVVAAAPGSSSGSKKGRSRQGRKTQPLG